MHAAVLLMPGASLLPWLPMVINNGHVEQAALTATGSAGCAAEKAVDQDRGN